MEQWEVLVTDEWLAWFGGLDTTTRALIVDAIDRLADTGPMLGRPLVDRMHGASVHNMKELRPGSAGSTEVRILFVFDPWRSAILLICGDTSRSWRGWYDVAIPKAERLYDEYLKETTSRGEFVMVTHAWKDIRPEIVAEIGEESLLEARARNQTLIDAHLLAERRGALGLTQSVVAERMGVTKGRISQIERGEVSTVDVIARYVEAIGGQLRVAAVFDHDELVLHGGDPHSAA